MTTDYDIFVSYRREGGEDKARNINQFLSAAGYRVFFDHDAAITGEFESVILAAVEVAPIFIMLLTPGCLDRCVNKDDWVRREIEHAVELGKEIIPIIPNGNFSFDNLPDNIPETVLGLKKIQFADVDYHKHFKSTANEMIEERVKPFVKPSLITIDNGDIGAKIHFFSDISCRVLHFGDQIAVTDAEDKISGAVARLLKGRHKLEFKSIEHEADAYNDVLTVADNDLEDFFEIKLQPIKDKRLEYERLRKEEENRLVEIERQRIEQERAQVLHTDKYKYDIFLCYSRQDATIVRQVYNILERSGYRCFMDIEGIQSGAFADQIIESIDNARCMLFFHSEHSSKSEWAVKELTYALGMGKDIIPVKLDDTQYAPALLSHLNELEYISVNKLSEVNKIVEILRKKKFCRNDDVPKATFLSKIFH